MAYRTGAAASVGLMKIAMATMELNADPGRHYNLPADGTASLL